MLKNIISVSLLLLFSLNGCFSINTTAEKIIKTEISESNAISEDINNQSVRENNLTELANPSGNYELTGIVKDLESKVPLEKVKIFVSSDNGINKETFTGNDGSYLFVFPRKGNAAITFSLENYQSKAEVIVIDNNKTAKDIFLKRIIFFNTSNNP